MCLYSDVSCFIPNDFLLLNCYKALFSFNIRSHQNCNYKTLNHFGMSMIDTTTMVFKIKCIHLNLGVYRKNYKMEFPSKLYLGMCLQSLPPESRYGNCWWRALLAARCACADRRHPLRQTGSVSNFFHHPDLPRHFPPHWPELMGFISVHGGSSSTSNSEECVSLPVKTRIKHGNGALSL